MQKNFLFYEIDNTKLDIELNKEFNIKLDAELNVELDAELDMENMEIENNQGDQKLQEDNDYSNKIEFQALLYCS